MSEHTRAMALDSMRRFEAQKAAERDEFTELERAVLSAAVRYVRAKRKTDAFNEMWWNGTPSRPGYSSKARRIYYKWDERLRVAEESLCVAIDALTHTEPEATPEEGR